MPEANMPVSTRPSNSKSVGELYSLGAVIGIGSYGEVRYAQSIETGDKVALKIVDLGRFRQDTSSLMMQEIRILRMLKHPHCAGVLDVQENATFVGQWCDVCACSEFHTGPAGGSGSGNTCGNCQHSSREHGATQQRNVMLIAQELAMGGDVFGLLMHTGAFPEGIARFYFRQLISGIAYLHGRGIVHRDLKPENLVLDLHLQLKIIDFGLASNPRSEGEAVDTHPGTPVLHSGVGSLPYSAPEVYYSRELYGDRGYRGEPADIWSCAVILFVMLTGRPPFLRPLAKTYGPNMRRCKHFINLLKGNNYGNLTPAARVLMQKIFRLDPNQRATLQDIIQDPWFNGPVSSPEEISKEVSERVVQTYRAQGKDSLASEFLTSRQALLEQAFQRRSSPLNIPLKSHTQNDGLIGEVHSVRNHNYYPEGPRSAHEDEFGASIQYAGRTPTGAAASLQRRAQEGYPAIPSSSVPDHTATTEGTHHHQYPLTGASQTGPSGGSANRIRHCSTTLDDPSPSRYYRQHHLADRQAAGAGAGAAFASQPGPRKMGGEQKHNNGNIHPGPQQHPYPAAEPRPLQAGIRSSDHYIGDQRHRPMDTGEEEDPHARRKEAGLQPGEHTPMEFDEQQLFR